MDRVFKYIRNNYVAFALGLLAISICWAGSHGDSPLASDSVRNVLTVMRYAVVGLILFNLNNFTIRKPILAVLPFLFWFVTQIHQYPNARIPIDLLNTVCLILFAFIRPDQIVGAFKILKWFMVVTGALALFALISYNTKLPVPYSIVDYYITTHGGLYVNYGFSYIYMGSEGLRLCGLFNEPGYYGTFAALILIAEKLNFRKFTNIIILIAGVFTFSLAFFLLIIIYYIISSLKFSWESIFIVCALLVVYFVILPNIEIQNEQWQRLMERLSITNEGKLAGDDRITYELDSFFSEKMVDVKTILFGVGTGVLSVEGITSGLSIKSYILQYGYLGVFFFYGLLLLICFKEIKKVRNRNIKFAAYIYVVLYFINLYQRPALYSINCFVLLFGGIYYIMSYDDEPAIKLNENSVIH